LADLDPKSRAECTTSGVHRRIILQKKTRQRASEAAGFAFFSCSCANFVERQQTPASPLTQRKQRVEVADSDSAAAAIEQAYAYWAPDYDPA